MFFCVVLVMVVGFILVLLLCEVLFIDIYDDVDDFGDGFGVFRVELLEDVLEIVVWCMLLNGV